MILAPEVIQDAAKQPDSTRNAKQAEAAINTALREKQRLDPSMVSEAGKKFAEASDKNRAAWKATVGFLEYKSAFDVSEPSLPEPAPSPSGELETFYYQLGVKDRALPKLSFWGMAAMSESARLNRIGQDLNSRLSQGNMLLISENGAIVLDGMEARNVIYKNVEVHYSGGPVILTNVYFINCRFVMDQPSSRAIDLAGAILSSQSVSYKSA